MDRIDKIINESIQKVLLKEYEFDSERHAREWKFIEDYKRDVGEKYFSKKLFDFINFKGNLQELIRFIQIYP